MRHPVYKVLITKNAKNILIDVSEYFKMKWNVLHNTRNLGAFSNVNLLIPICNFYNCLQYKSNNL